MKKNNSFYNVFTKQIVIAIFIVLLTGSLFAEKTELSMLLWSRYTAAQADDEITENGFALKRGYLTIKQTFTDKIKGRFTTDICSSDEDLDASGASLKVKYAYLEFADLLPLGKNKIQAGLIKSYFGGSPDYKGIIVDPAFVIKERIIPSVDYGVAYLGSNGIVNYVLEIVNGEGYKNSGSNVDTEPAFIGDVKVKASRIFSFGGSYLTKKEFDAVSGLVDFKFGKFDARFEFVQKTIDSENETGYSVTPALNLSKFQLTGRYDCWQDSHKRIVAGVNWKLHKSEKSTIRLQTNLERTINDIAETHKDYLFVQLEWSFASVLGV